MGTWHPNKVVVFIIVSIMELLCLLSIIRSIYILQLHQFIAALLVGIFMGAAFFFGISTVKEKKLPMFLQGRKRLQMVLILLGIGLSWIGINLLFGEDAPAIGMAVVGGFMMIFVGFAGIIGFRNPPQE
jgi:hypothetical protein